MKCASLIAAAAALAPALAVAAEPGPWTFKALGAGGAGQTYFVAQTPSRQTLVGLGDKAGKAQLAVRCDPKGLFVTFLWPDFVSADTYDAKVIDVDLRVDNDKPRRVKLTKVDQAAIALGKTGYRLLKDVSKGQTLSVHLPDFHGGQDATFQIEGITDIFARVTAQGCDATQPSPDEKPARKRRGKDEG
jgi:hypothetical protein